MADNQIKDGDTIAFTYKELPIKGWRIGVVRPKNGGPETNELTPGLVLVDAIVLTTGYRVEVPPGAIGEMKFLSSAPVEKKVPTNKNINLLKPKGKRKK